MKLIDINRLKYFLEKLKGKLDLKAPIDSPSFTGTPTAPTAVTATDTAQIATTAFVQSNIKPLRTILGGFGKSIDVRVQQNLAEDGLEYSVDGGNTWETLQYGYTSIIEDVLPFMEIYGRIHYNDGALMRLSENFVINGLSTPTIENSNAFSSHEICSDTFSFGACYLSYCPTAVNSAPKGLYIYFD